jgi:hypothetical protein
MMRSMWSWTGVPLTSKVPVMRVICVAGEKKMKMMDRGEKERIAPLSIILNMIILRSAAVRRKMDLLLINQFALNLVCKKSISMF